MSVPVLRVARPTSRLDESVAFYRDGLGFGVLTSFEAHDGFDGVILGHPDAPWHLELTREHGVTAPDAPTPAGKAWLAIGTKGRLCAKFFQLKKVESRFPAAPVSRNTAETPNQPISGSASNPKFQRHHMLRPRCRMPP